MGEWRCSKSLAIILERFGEVTGICTNFQTSFVGPIKCGHIKLDDIIECILATHTSFVWRYIGLSLSFWCLRRVNFQKLRTNMPGNSPLGMANTSPQSAAPL
jgi:hypothetical protein